jgi:hypothetical protein
MSSKCCMIVFSAPGSTVPLRCAGCACSAAAAGPTYAVLQHAQELRLRRRRRFQRPRVGQDRLPAAGAEPAAAARVAAEAPLRLVRKLGTGRAPEPLPRLVLLTAHHLALAGPGSLPDVTTPDLHTMKPSDVCLPSEADRLRHRKRGKAGLIMTFDAVSHPHQRSSDLPCALRGEPGAELRCG